MEDDYLDDAEFYDGLEDDPGQPYMEIGPPARLTGVPVEAAAPELPPAPPAPAPIPAWMWTPPDASPPPARLLTPEEFMAKYHLPRPE